MSFIFRCVGSLFLAACSTGCVSTQSVAEHLGARYVGKSFDDFAIVHGAPYKSFALSSGETAYVWNSGVTSVGMPATATTTGYGNMATTTFSGGGTINMSCEVQFIASTQGIVQKVSILRDTIGGWTTSRCHEVLK